MTAVATPTTGKRCLNMAAHKLPHGNAKGTPHTQGNAKGQG